MKPYVFAVYDEVDPEYYVTNQVVPVAARILEFFGVTEKELVSSEVHHEETKRLTDFL